MRIALGLSTRRSPDEEHTLIIPSTLPLPVVKLVYADWMILLLKLLLVPMFIGLVSLSSSKWRPIVGGWLIGLPLTSGPVAFFLALEQGNAFASAASKAIMMGIISVFTFALAYTWSATRHQWRLSLLAGLCAYFDCTLLLNSIEWSLLISFILVLGVLMLTLLMMPHVRLGKATYRTGWGGRFPRAWFRLRF